MVVGILFCCSLAMGIDGLSVVIGLIITIIGVLFLINSVISKTSMCTAEGVWGVVLVSLGIMFIVSRLAGLIFVYIPWLLIVLGIVIASDALLGKFVSNKDTYVTFAIKLTLGILSLALGLCLRLIDGFDEYAAIIIGIIMIGYSLYMLFNVFVKDKKVKKISE